MSSSVGIVIPAFRPDVDRLCAYVESLQETLSPATIRVEIDDPDPRTVEALADLPVDVHTVPYRRGKGGAITMGFEALETDVYAFFDADGSTGAAAAATVLAPVLDGEADVAVGSRRHPDSTILGHQTFARRFLGDGFAWLAGRLLDVSLDDYQCGAKAITADAWASVREHLYESGFAWDVELVAMAGALEFSVQEVPIEWEDRPGSTVSPLRTSLSLGRAVLRARHRAKQLRDSPFHNAIARARDDPVSLVDKHD